MLSKRKRSGCLRCDATSFSIAIGNLLWEIAHFPLYTLWSTGTLAEQVFAIVHCTAGDLVIALCALALGLLAAGDTRWPVAGFARVAFFAVIAGVGYTIFSERLNVEVRKSWAYSPAMPIVPFLGVGLTPLLQWVLVPIAAFLFVRRANSGFPR